MRGTYSIALDLGTANTAIYMPGKGIVLREPSMIAEHSETGAIEAVGLKAQKLMERTPENIDPIRPIQDGVVVDHDRASAMLHYFFRKTWRKAGLFALSKWRKPNVVVSVPTGVTAVERRAIQEVVEQAGAHHVHMIEEALAAALGAGLPVWEPVGNMIVSIGGGSLGAAVVSYGGIVSRASIRVAGDEMDEAIIQYVQHTHNLQIGKQTAESLKMELGYALHPDKPETKEIQGRDIVTDLPKIVRISSEEIYEALSFIVDDLIEVVKMTLSKTPPELVSDLIDAGIVLTGGGVLLRQMNESVRQKINIPVHIADQPLDCVVLGAGKALDYPRLFSTA